MHRHGHLPNEPNCAFKMDECHCVNSTSNVKKVVAWEPQAARQHELYDKNIRQCVLPPQETEEAHGGNVTGEGPVVRPKASLLFPTAPTWNAQQKGVA